MGVPIVSVVMPVWRAEGTLAEALADVRAQTLGAWECVVVLDGEADRSGDVAREYMHEDARFRVVARPHAGIVAALNAGLEAARAPLVARFDADDRMAPTRLARQVELLDRRPEVTLVSCGVALEVGGDHRHEGMLRHAAWLDTLDTPEKMRAARFVDAPVAHPAVTFRKADVLAAGGYRDGPFAEDHDLWLRLFGAGAVFDRVPEALVTWRDHAARLTRTDRRYADAERRALVHHHLLAPGGPLDGRAARIWGAGEYGKRHARELAARGARLSDLLDIDPRKIGQTIAGLPVTDAATLGPPDGRVVLACVASPGARALIAARLAARGWSEDHDWWARQ
ncbi:MAG: glycosyltransferase [Deltaproteobacteria bacterium]|nr:glycosyltransferase [Deltaproteobacteria bacterium]